MHRVELKGVISSNTSSKRSSRVPNAPCGVERRSFINDCLNAIEKFLMHRVELKAAYQD
jgi:hypothetical protein